MKDTKTMIRFFTIADYEEEEIWLRSQHKSGWKLVKTVMPCFFIFEKCTPEDVVYRLDFKANAAADDYFQIFEDYGWEYFNEWMGWLYFRKPVTESDLKQDSEIFSDDESRLDMLSHVFKTRLFPLLVIFFGVLVPNFANSFGQSGPLANVLRILFSLFMLVYLYVFLRCGIKLRKMKDQYRKE